jgi:hypothetical protein
MKKRFLPFVNRRFVHSVGMPVCAGNDLPETDFDYCDPEVESSEIGRVFIRRVNSADFSDWTQAEEWTTRISENSADPDAIRALTVIGDKPLPNAPKKIISGGRTVIPRKEHTVNITIDEVTATNHALMQATEGGMEVKFNYEAGKFMFGGNQSITATLTLEMVLARGAGEIMVYNGTLFWVSPTTEDRCLSPIYGETVMGSTSLDTTIDFTADATPTHGDCDFVLAGGVSPTAKFRYNDINPTYGVPLVMTIKVGGTLKLTCNMTADFNTQPFSFTDTAGVTHTGFIAAGDVNF